MAEAKVLDSRLGDARSAERMRSEDGTLNLASIVWLTEISTLRSKRRRNSGGLEDSEQDSPSGYDFYVPRLADIQFLIFDCSQNPEERQKENGSGGQNAEQRANG